MKLSQEQKNNMKPGSFILDENGKLKKNSEKKSEEKKDEPKKINKK